MSLRRKGANFFLAMAGIIAVLIQRRGGHIPMTLNTVFRHVRHTQPFKDVKNVAYFRFCE